MSTDKDLYGLYRYFDLEHYGNFNKYKPGSELINIVRAVIPLDWNITKIGNWYKVLPPVYDMPKQGWKIHISAMPSNCAEIITQVTQICAEKNIPYKFLLDTFVVELSTSKSWTREASGKFITIYPQNEEAFKEQIELFYEQLKDFNGAYILTDKRYKDSKIIYYRYGGIIGEWGLGVYGEKKYMLTAPNGDQVPDFRAPYWNPPYWIEDIFDFTSNEDEDDSLTLNNGRYVIQEPLHFSVTGGVYLALDLDTGSNVIIKEARPHTAVDIHNLDATDRLASEFKFLKMFKEMNIVPKPIDYFKDWEHYYLVEEYVEGLDLAKWSVTHNPLILESNYDEYELEKFLIQIKYVWLNTARIVNEFHKLNLRCGDISSKNIIITNFENGTVKMIDLEVVSEINSPYIYPLGTPGFQRNNDPYSKKTPSLHDDIYALGVLFTSTLFPNSNFRDLDQTAHTRYVDSLMNDFKIEPHISELIHKILEHPTQINITEIIEILENWISFPVQSTASVDECNSLKQVNSTENLEEVVDQIANYINENANIMSKENLFPADPMVFETNSLNLSYGALGIAYALHKVNKDLSDKSLNWIFSQNISGSQYPPGLFHGLSGIAWAMCELGYWQYAEKILDAASKHHLLSLTSDLMNGLAGYGMTCLHFYEERKNEYWLKKALEVGDSLLLTKKEFDYGIAWEDHEQKIWLGYAKGASGIALFLLYLYLATKDERFLAVGKKAIEFDLHHATMHGEALYLPLGFVGGFQPIKNVYWMDGATGLGMSLIRYWAVTKDEKYFAAFKGVVHTCNRKYSAFPSLFKGLAGMGHLLLDGYAFTGDNNYMEAATKVLSGTMLFKLQRSSGVAFPGEQLFRISCDYATGSAGVMLFLERYQHIEHKRENPNFLIDSLLADYFITGKSNEETTTIL